MVLITSKLCQHLKFSGFNLYSFGGCETEIQWNVTFISLVINYVKELFLSLHPIQVFYFVMFVFFSLIFLLGCVPSENFFNGSTYLISYSVPDFSAQWDSGCDVILRWKEWHWEILLSCFILLIGRVPTLRKREARHKHSPHLLTSQALSALCINQADWLQDCSFLLPCTSSIQRMSSPVQDWQELMSSLGSISQSISIGSRSAFLIQDQF